MSQFKRTDYVLICPHCLALGNITWDAPADEPASARRKLVHIAGLFHAEPGRGKGARTTIVCDGCDTIQPD